VLTRAVYSFKVYNNFLKTTILGVGANPPPPTLDTPHQPPLNSPQRALPMQHLLLGQTVTFTANPFPQGLSP